MNYHFQCIDCGKEYKANELEYVCPSCASAQKPMEPTRGVLKVMFDYSSSEFRRLAKRVEKRFLGSRLAGARSNDNSWWIPILPISDISLLPPLQVGPTPLYSGGRLGEELGLKQLYIKDDTGLPSASFKDRASALVVAKARELGKDTIVTASTGNAATALACMCASVGMKAVIYAPAKAPLAKLTQILIYGAELNRVDGTYDDAYELSLEATRKHGWYNRNTAYNPFTIEGKKTAALEIWEQLGGKAPDKIFIPTGDGVILAGIYKGFWDLLQLGLVDKLPQLIAVQAEGSAVIARALSEGDVILSEAKNLQNKIKGGGSFSLRLQDDRKQATTIADSICVSAPRNLNWAVKAIRESGGTAITVTDDEIINAISHLGRTTGIFAEPAAAASLAGLVKCVSLRDRYRRAKQSPSSNVGDCHALRARNDMQDETIVILITGSGLKDIPAAQAAIKKKVT